MDMFYVKMYLRKDSEGKNSHIQRERERERKMKKAILSTNVCNRMRSLFFFALKNPARNISTRDECG